jgi:SAM-dependent methyltransferase
MNSGGEMFSDGAAYERLMGRWSSLVAEQFLDWLAAPKALRWLDAGCGNGAFTETLIGRCAPANVMAIDPSEGQLAYARTRPAAKLAEFRLGDAQALPFDDDSFDAAAMALVIAFVPDAAKAAAEMARVVRPGGVVATYMWDIAADGAPSSPLYRAMEALGRPPSKPPYAQYSGRQAMQDIWTAAGLQAVETRAIRIPVAFTNLDDFWTSNIVPIGPQGMLYRQMSPEELLRLREVLSKQLPIAADGRIAYEAVANCVKGRVPQ